jgi:hypothetical protein
MADLCHSGAMTTTPDTTQAPAPPVPDANTKFLTLVGVGTVVALALLCIGGMLWNVFTDGPKPDGGGALTACREYVKDRLKAPSTARFSDLNLTGSGSRWTVVGAVSAENSFGGTIDMGFTCTVSGSGTNWSLVSLTGING